MSRSSARALWGTATIHYTGIDICPIPSIPLYAGIPNSPGNGSLLLRTHDSDPCTSISQFPQDMTTNHYRSTGMGHRLYSPQCGKTQSYPDILCLSRHIRDKCCHKPTGNWCWNSRKIRHRNSDSWSTRDIHSCAQSRCFPTGSSRTRHRVDRNLR